MNFVEITPEEFRDFAATSPYKSFMQTPEIAELREKDGWVPYYLAVKENGEIKAATLALAKPTFLGKSTFLTPGGPLLDFENQPLTTFFLRHLKHYAKTHNGYVLHIDPYYELIARDRTGQKVEGGFDRTPVLKTLLNLGFKPTDDGQPKYLFVMDVNNRKEDEIFADFKSNTRNHVRKAEKMGVKVRELGREELPILKQITQSTSVRRGFHDRPLSYYEQMYDLFANQNQVKFMVAECVLSRGAELENGATRGLPEVTEAAVTCSAEHEDLARAARSVSEGHATAASVTIPLSAAMFMLYGDEVVYLFSGSDEKYMKDYNAQYAIQWEIIKYAAKNGFKTYNFYGIQGLPDPAKKDYGIYEFKKGFTSEKTGRVVELLGAQEAPLSAPFYYLHQLLSKIKH